MHLNFTCTKNAWCDLSDIPNYSRENVCLWKLKKNVFLIGILFKIPIYIARNIEQKHLYTKTLCYTWK